MKEIHVFGAPLAEDSITAISYIRNKDIDKRKENTVQNGLADFETAISGVGFGKFNIMLIITTIPSSMASIFATTAMSFMLSEAECDLSLNLEDKGLLNAITYIGMICSAFFWGMIGDTYGRRTVLLYSYSLDAITYLLGSLSSEKWMLLTAKFLSGLVMCGPIAVFMTFLSEFHSKSFRPKIITIAGVCYGTGRTALPLLAWWIMPLKLHLVVIEGVLELKSWQIFYLICCIPSLLAGIAHYLLPETPKFLMTKGRYDEAMVLFRKIYTINTGNPPEMLPFSGLYDATYDDRPEYDIKQDELIKKSKLALFKNILHTMKALFLPPYLMKTFLMSGILFGGLLGGNTLRLWLPTIFTKMDTYMQMNNGENSDATFCEMLDYTPKNINDVFNKNISNSFSDSSICITPDISDEVYINNTIVPVCSIVGYFILAAIVTTIGKKTILVIQYILSGVIIIANYWSTNSLTTVVLSSLFLTFFSICATTATSITVELFPTNMRTMACSIALLCGRVGSILGNTLFPVLLQMGCLPPFLFIGGFMFLCAIFSSMLPGTENKPLR